jgi:hypothetical protein
MLPVVVPELVDAAAVEPADAAEASAAAVAAAVVLGEALDRPTAAGAAGRRNRYETPIAPPTSAARRRAPSPIASHRRGRFRAVGVEGVGAGRVTGSLLCSDVIAVGDDDGPDSTRRV